MWCARSLVKLGGVVIVLELSPNVVPATPPLIRRRCQRTVLVTGAAKRLGREIALTLARAGWRVAVHYRDSVEDARKTVADCARLAGASASFRANLANETAVRNLLPSVIEAVWPGRRHRQQRLHL